jgi:NAD(P)-dependent dehydrogenase (short-subunit alcohol dehydrogenase family)
MSKTILITGAYGNLGRAVVNASLAAGYEVLGTAAPGEKAPDGFPAVNVDIKVVDLLDEEATAQAFGEWIGPKTIDAAVFTVGGFAMGDIASTGSADLLKQFRLNVETLYHSIRPVLGQMKVTGRGRLFMIGARPATDMKLAKGMTAYGLSKSLVFRLAELINAESAGTDIVASVIVPSTLDTPQNRASMPDADPAAWVKPEDIASTILFYCSPAASSIREPVIKLYGRA